MASEADLKLWQKALDVLNEKHEVGPLGDVGAEADASLASVTQPFRDFEDLVKKIQDAELRVKGAKRLFWRGWPWSFDEVVEPIQDKAVRDWAYLWAAQRSEETTKFPYDKYSRGYFTEKISDAALKNSAKSAPHIPLWLPASEPGRVIPNPKYYEE